MFFFSFSNINILLIIFNTLLHTATASHTHMHSNTHTRTLCIWRQQQNARVRVLVEEFSFTVSTNRTHRKSLENCSACAADATLSHELSAANTANDVATTMLPVRRNATNCWTRWAMWHYDCSCCCMGKLLQQQCCSPRFEWKFAGERTCLTHACLSYFGTVWWWLRWVQA